MPLRNHQMSLISDNVILMTFAFFKKLAKKPKLDKYFDACSEDTRHHRNITVIMTFHDPLKSLVTQLILTHFLANGVELFISRIEKAVSLFVTFVFCVRGLY